MGLSAPPELFHSFHPHGLRYREKSSGCVRGGGGGYIWGELHDEQLCGEGLDMGLELPL